MKFATILRRPVAWLAFAALLSGSRPAHAERVALKTGETVLGKVITERTNVNVLVIEDYVSGGQREFVWEAVDDADARRLQQANGIIDVGNTMVPGELVVYRLNTGTGEIRGIVEKVEGGALFLRNVSSKDPLKIALADVVTREPIELDPQEIWTLDEVVKKRFEEKEPQDAQAWFLFGQFCERVGAYERAKEAYDTVATDEAYLQRDLARAASVKMAALIADKGSFDELRDLRVAMGASLWKRVREGTDTFLTRHPDASDPVKKKLDELKAEFTKKRATYFADVAGKTFGPIARRLIELKVRPKDAVFNDVQAWIRKDVIEEAFDKLLKDFQLRDAAVTAEEAKSFFEARPKKANGWKRASYDSGSFLIEPAKIKPPSGQPKPAAGSSKKNNNSGPAVVIPVPKPPTRDTWWESASGEVRARFWWATFVEKAGLFEVQPKRDRIACSTCDAAGKLTKLGTSGASLEYLCPRCGGSQYDQVVDYR
jgi:hypothetical protein